MLIETRGVPGTDKLWESPQQSRGVSHWTKVFVKNDGPAKGRCAAVGCGERFLVIDIAYEDVRNALLKAMGMALQVVAARVGGNPEVLEEGLTGLLVEPGDVSALAAAIEQLVVDAERRRAMGQRGRERVATAFSMDRWVERLDAAYQEVLSA